MKLIVGNWKMFPETLREAESTARKIKAVALKHPKTRVVLCPPYVFVAPLRKIAAKSAFKIGAQNVFFEDKGARTGEISPPMLADLGVLHVIVGHSERRALGETNEVIAAKVVAATKRKLTVILCVGEQTREGEEGSHYALVRDQLRASLSGVSSKFASSIVIAYEPVWAIGVNAKGSATPEDFREMAILIRKQLVEQFGKKSAFAIPILYGGSVDDRNALGFLDKGGADGLLIGRVSLVPEQLGAIIKAANTIR